MIKRLSPIALGLTVAMLCHSVLAEDRDQTEAADLQAEGSEFEPDAMTPNVCMDAQGGGYSQGAILTISGYLHECTFIGYLDGAPHFMWLPFAAIRQ